MLLDLIPGRTRAVVHERDDDVEARLECQDGLFADRLDELLPQVAPADAEHRQNELDDLAEIERFRQIHALHRSREPIDQAALEMNEEVVCKEVEPGFSGLDEIPDEADRVLDDVLERGTDLFDVRHGTGCDHFENDLEQVEHRREGPVEEVLRERAEDSEDFGEDTADVEEIFQLDRFKRVDESSGQGGDQVPKARHRVLEPLHRPRNGVRALDVFPDLFFADQLHEAADQLVGPARDLFAGDRILPEHRA